MRASLLSVLSRDGASAGLAHVATPTISPRYRKFSRAPPTPSDDSQNDACIHEYHEPLCSHSLTGDTTEEADQTLDVCAWRCKIDMKTSGPARATCIPVAGSSSLQSSRTRAPFSSAKSCRNSHASRGIGATQPPAPLEERPVAESISQGFARKFACNQESQPKHVKQSAFYLAQCAKRRTCSCNKGHVETSEQFPPRPEE